MAKHKLVLEEDYDFILLGICSHVKDYRLAWLFNKLLSLKLVRSEKDLVNWSAPKAKHLNFACFNWQDEEEFRTYYLIGNNSAKIKLVPDQKQFDFFLMITGDFDESVSELVNTIKTLPEILIAYEINVSDINKKHLQNLLPDE